MKVSLVITDLDNTLFDWVDIWYKSFSAMLESLVAKSGVPRDVLISEIRDVHQRHGTAEYAFLIEELPSLNAKHGGENLLEVYAESVEAFRSARSSALKLYPTVGETLQLLKGRGCRIVGYTESMEFYSLYRIRNLGLDGLLDYVYTPPDHSLPEGLTRDAVRHHPPESYRLRHTENRHTPQGELKPNPKLLSDIFSELGGNRETTIYVGDSLMKDVAMAQAAKVIDVWARYGTAQHRQEYELLRQVTHWTAEAVQKEKDLTQTEVKPHYVLENSFDEILGLFDFVASQEKASSANSHP